MTLVLRDGDVRDHTWIAARLRERWGGPRIWSRGVGHDVLEGPILVAEQAGTPCGLLAYRVARPECEIVVIDAWPRFAGTGSALLARVAVRASEADCTRLWLVTTNDNVDALRFYQRRGFRLARIHRGAVDDARIRKPSIPAVGEHGIPIHDEIELERRP